MGFDRSDLLRAISTFQSVLDFPNENISWTSASAEPQELFSDKTVFGVILKEVSALKRTREAIATMQTFLSVDISRLEALLRRPAFHHGLNSLPDEILRKIFILAIKDDNLRETPRGALNNFLFVSKRFHDLLIDDTEVWSHLNTNDGAKLIERKLSKTNGVKLHFHISFSRAWDSDYTKVVRMLSGRAADCSHLYIKDRSQHVRWYYHKLRPDEHFPLWTVWESKVFSSVEAFFVREAFLLPDAGTFPLLASLSIGKVTDISPVAQLVGLRHLHLSNKVELLEEDHLPWSELAGVDVLEALRHSPYLETLSLCGFSLNEDEEGANGVDPIRLDHLLSLTLSALGDRNSWSGPLVRMARLSRTLRIPSLNSFDLSSEYDKMCYESKSAPIFFADEDRASVRNLHFHFEARRRDVPFRDEAGRYLPQLFEQFPNAQSLSLRSSISTDIFEALGQLLEKQLLHLDVYGGWSALAFLPRIIKAVRDVPDTKLREAILHVRHDLIDDYMHLPKESREYGYGYGYGYTVADVDLDTPVMFDHSIGNTNISVLVSERVLS